MSEGKAATGGKSICIVCKEEKQGSPVREDVVINTIRSIKQTLKMSTNNRLVVCSDCVSAHKERRAKFERNLLMYSAIGVLMGIVIIILAFMNGNWGGIVVGALLAVFMTALSIFSYHPASEAK